MYWIIGKSQGNQIKDPIKIAPFVKMIYTFIP